MDRKPLAAPFPVGTQVRYLGTRRIWCQATDGSEVTILGPGLVATVSETKPGYRGTLATVRPDWEPYECDEPAVDQTVDGYSVYYAEVPGRKPQGRIIWPADAHEWEKV